MSLDRLSELPNGLHDAELVSLHVNYADGEVVLVVNVDVSHPEESAESQSPSYRRVHLHVRDVQFVVIDPPHGSPAFKGLSRIDGGDGQPQGNAIDLPQLQAGAFLCWIYVESSNSFIRIGAKSVAVVGP